MKFNTIDSGLLASEVVKAEKKFLALTVELGVRRDNEHVGSGLGGNLIHLLTLTNVKNHLVSSDLFRIKVQDNNIFWNAKWLNHKSITDIRVRFNKIIKQVEEKYKISALIFGNAILNNNLIRVVNDNLNDYPGIVYALNGYHYDPKISFKDELIISLILCKELANDLDKKDYSRIESIAAFLDKVTVENVLVSVRTMIKIERIVMHNLDEHKFFGPLLCKVINCI
jgi:hypothetical protein